MDLVQNMRGANEGAKIIGAIIAAVLALLTALGLMD